MVTLGSIDYAKSSVSTFADITESSVCRIENESKVKFEFRFILAPSPLILILILSVMGSKSVFCLKKSEICILNTVSTQVTSATQNLSNEKDFFNILFFLCRQGTILSFSFCLSG